MSTNGQVILHGEDFRHPVVFYQHSDAYNLGRTLADALARGNERWEDGPYLARIIFSEMIKDYVLEETGYGISTNQMNCGRYTWNVYVDKMEIENDGDTWTFPAFVEKFETKQKETVDAEN